MNIKITKQQFEILKQYTISEFVFGSHLYGTDKETSDKDILLIIDELFVTSKFYPNIHCFQFDDVDNNIQYMITTRNTFNKNLLSGESNIFAELVLFCDTYTEFANPLQVCRSYKIIKGFIGRAKFDIKLLWTSKDKKNLKAFHISRCLYIAECLLDGKLPDLTQIGYYCELTKTGFQEKELELRNRCNAMFEKDELTMFPDLKLINNNVKLNEFETLLTIANNTKEFTY